MFWPFSETNQSAVLDNTRPAKAMTLKIRDDSGLKDVAAMLMLLGDDIATAIMRQMSEPIIEAIANAMVDIKTLDTAEALRLISRLAFDFSDSGVELPGGIEFVRRTLTEAFGQERASELLNKMFQKSDEKLDLLDKIDPKILTAQVGMESTQLQAVMLAHMKRRTAVTYLNGLPEDAVSEILYRYAQIDAVQPAALTEMRLMISEILRGQTSSRATIPGGVRQAAELLNEMETQSAENALAAIRAHDERLADEVRDNMFTFEDLVRLDDQSLRLVLREIDVGKLAPALRAASSDMRDRIYANISTKLTEILRDEVENGPPVTRAQAQASQKVVTEATLRLALAGKISLAGSGDML